jgi:hypothetical protein
MAANPSIANPNFIPDVEQTDSEDRNLTQTTVLEHAEEILRKAFGDTEETIANSLRGL